MNKKPHNFSSTLSGLGVLLICLCFFAATPGISEEKTVAPAKSEQSGSGTWSEDLKAATALAKKENKLLFILFTGSDWCGWCKKLNSEVFSSSKFTGWANKNVVLLKADFPNKIKQSAELSSQNKQLASRYNIKGFPTVVITNADGKEIARTGYQRGGVTPYIKYLNKICKQKGSAK
ncbi:MAG: thioredoxin family protein [Victivallales bacterium]|jgi:protein disulfide-isomerase|nr:thioredoxin family protein [Victivallales bacterium]